MATILSSGYVLGATQADGSVAVRETHVVSDGTVITHDYMLPLGVDPDAVMTQRAARHDAELQLRTLTGQIAADGLIHLTKLKFRRLFTLSERVLIDAFNASFESNPILTDEQKGLIRTYLQDLSEAEGVYLDDEGTVAGIQMYVSLGLLSAERAAEILNGQ